MTKTLPICLAFLSGLALASTGEARSQDVLTAAGAYNVHVVSLRDIPFRTVVRQQYDYSCGSAALATLLTYHYSDPIGEAEIFRAMYAAGDQAKIRKVGFSLLDIKKYLSARGYQADGFRLTPAQLKTFNSPGIAVVSVGAYKHFVVIKGVKNDQVLVGDPAIGLKTYSISDFGKIWNGILFAVHSTPQMKVAWNKDDEWKPWAAANLGQPLSDDSLASLSRDMPPIYQITPMIYSNPVP